MPVGLDFQALQQRCLAWLDDESNDGTLLTNVKNSLNDANAQRASEFNWPFMKVNQPASAILTASTTLALATDVAKLIYLYNTTQQRFYRVVPERHVRSDDVLGTNNNDNSDYLGARVSLRGPTNSSTSAITVEFFKTPTAGETLKYDYYRMPTIMSSNTDYPDIPFPHSQLLVWDALLNLKAYALEPDAISVWMDNQQRALSSLYTAYGTVGDVVGAESESIIYNAF